MLQPANARLHSMRASPMSLSADSVLAKGAQSPRHPGQIGPPMSTAPSLSATQTPERSTPSADAVRAARAQENDTAVHVKDDMESSLLGDYKVTYENPSGSGRCIATAVALRKRLGLTGLIAVLLTVSVMVLIVIVLVESSRHVPAVVAPIRTREVCNVSSLWNTSRHPSCNGGPSLPVGSARPGRRFAKAKVWNVASSN